MPWKESSVMEERLRFVARLLEGDSMTHVCRHFGISRKTGYKIYNRYKQDGIWLVTFMHYDLGYIDLEQRTLQTIDTPFGTSVLPMS